MTLRMLPKSPKRNSERVVDVQGDCHSALFASSSQTDENALVKFHHIYRTCLYMSIYHTMFTRSINALKIQLSASCPICPLIAPPGMSTLVK